MDSKQENEIVNEVYAHYLYWALLFFIIVTDFMIAGKFLRTSFWWIIILYPLVSGGYLLLKRTTTIETIHKFFNKISNNENS